MSPILTDGLRSVGRAWPADHPPRFEDECKGWVARNLKALSSPENDFESYNGRESFLIRRGQMSDQVSDLPSGVWGQFIADVDRCAKLIVDSKDMSKMSHVKNGTILLSLGLAARTVSNLNAVNILISQNQIIESRIIARNCWENFYCAAALVEKGDEYSDWLNREHHKRLILLGRFLLQHSEFDGVESSRAIRQKIKSSQYELGIKGSASENESKLEPKYLSHIRRDLEKSYVFYMNLSLDAAHVTLRSLGRHMLGDDTGAALTVSVGVPCSTREVEETLQCAASASLGVLVAVNQFLGFTPGGENLDELAKTFEALCSTTESRLTQPS